MTLDPVVLAKVSGALFVAWLTGYGLGVTFRSFKQFIEKAIR